MNERNTYIYINKNFIYTLKSLAIFSVVCAHSVTTYNSNTYIALFIKNIGTIGVVVFFILSGYLMKVTNRYTSILKETKIVLQSWFFSGICMYFITSYFGVGKTDFFNLISFFKFIFGLNSYYYYLVNYFLFKLLFKFRFIRTHIFSFMILSFISIVLTSLNLLVNFNPYLNFFNWIGFYSFGFFLKDDEKLELLVQQCIKNRIYIVLGFLIFINLSIYFNFGYYWTYFSLPMEILGFLFFLIVSKTYLQRNNTFILIGKQSFFIYLFHMPVIGAINSITKYSDSQIILILKPFIVILIMTIFVKILSLVTKSKKIRYIYTNFIGLKEF